jgi:hypothetical protein
MAYTAAVVTIMRPTGLTEMHTVSFGGGEPTEEMRQLHLKLRAYADGTTHKIADILEAQGFLVGSGYGLSNVILLEISPLFYMGLD